MSDPQGPREDGPSVPSQGSAAAPDRLQRLADGLAGDGGPQPHPSPLRRLVWAVLLLAASVPFTYPLTTAYRKRLAGEDLSADGYPAFFALYGILACLVLILLARLLALALARKDTYYDAE